MSDGALLIADCDYLLGPALERRRGWIAIEHGRIAALGGPDDPEPERLAHRLSAAGHLAMPALVNAHVHLRDAIAPEAAIGQDLARAVIGPDSTRARAIAGSSREDRVAAIRANLDFMGSLGVALVGDFCDGGLAGIAESREAAAGSGVEVVVLGRLFASIDRPVPFRERLTTEQLRELDAVLEAGDGFASASVNDYGDEAWRQIAERARARGKLLAVHAAEHSDQTRLSLATTGRSDVERALAFAPDHLVHLSAADAATLRPALERRVPVVCCPRANSLLTVGFSPLAPLFAQSVPVALGTDNIMLNAPNPWREAEFASKAFRARVGAQPDFTPADLLRALTLNGALALGRGAESGCILPGKRADLVLIDLAAPMLARASDLAAALVHRLEPQAIAGSVSAGLWRPNPGTRLKLD